MPKAFALLLATFAALVTTRVWHHGHVLRVRALLAPGKRTVTAAFRVRGLAPAKSFQPDHRVLNRAVWSSVPGSRLLLHVLRHTLAPAGPWGMGVDNPLERRRGTQSRAHGLDRDPVCSFHSDGVNASGWRWLSLMRLGPRPWATRVGAVPVVTVLAPAERSPRDRGQQPTKRQAWARPMPLVVRRGVPARPLVLGTPRRGAVITWRWRLSRVAPPLSSLTRVRLDAALYDPARPRTPRQTGRPRVQGQRLPTVAEVLANPATGGHTATRRGWQGAGARVGARVSATAVWAHAGRPPLPIRGVRGRDPPGPFAPQALRWTDLTAEPAPILEWFVRRWRLEVTWQEAHAHLGLETPRHGHAWAIARTTPALRGRFSRLTR